MDKNNNSSSSSSVCTKIRQALTSNHAVRAVQRITSLNQEPKPHTKVPNSQPSITNINIQNKPPPHHHNNKAHTQGSGAIPIKFDHTTPKLNQNYGNSSVAKRATKVGIKDDNMQGKQHGHYGVHQHMTEPSSQGKKMDINDNFKEFIQNTREKMMRSVTNIGWAHQSNHTAETNHGEAQHGANKNETHFSDFIQRARKKLRTTTTVRKSNYSKKE